MENSWSDDKAPADLEGLRGFITRHTPTGNRHELVVVFILQNTGVNLQKTAHKYVQRFITHVQSHCSSHHTFG